MMREHAAIFRQEALGLWVPENQLSEYKKYFRKVWSVTKKCKNKLFQLWNGECFYTGKILNYYLVFYIEYYPTIDHKLSIFYGFKNNIDPLFIGSLENLCICSRKINVEKGAKTHLEFIKQNVVHCS